jgi:hypothetical protein
MSSRTRRGARRDRDPAHTVDAVSDHARADQLIGPVWAILLARRLWKRDPTVIRKLRRTHLVVPWNRCTLDLVRRLDAAGG